MGEYEDGRLMESRRERASGGGAAVMVPMLSLVG